MYISPPIHKYPRNDNYCLSGRIIGLTPSFPWNVAVRIFAYVLIGITVGGLFMLSGHCVWFTAYWGS